MMNAFRTLFVSASALVAVTGCTTTTTSESSGPASTGQAVLTHRDPIARSQLREQALDRLAESVASPDPQARAHALEGLLTAPSRLGPNAALGLADDNEGVRSVAAMVAGRAQLRNLRPALTTLQYDDSPFVAASAIYALDRIGADVNPSRLGELLFDARSSRVRAHAAFILGEMGDDAALPMLADAARKRTPGSSVIEQRLLELQIAEAMVKLGDRSQLDSIRAALLPTSEDELEATVLAVQIIGTVDDRASIPRLRFLTGFKDGRNSSRPAELLMAIGGSLGELGDDTGSFLVDPHVASPSPMIRAQAARAYGRIGLPVNLDKLAHLAEDESELVRIAASTAILEILGTNQRAAR